MPPPIDMDPVTSGADPTTPLETFNNATIATGGDSKLYNLNVFYDVSESRDRRQCGANVTRRAISLG